MFQFALSLSQSAIQSYFSCFFCYNTYLFIDWFLVILYFSTVESKVLGVHFNLWAFLLYSFTICCYSGFQFPTGIFGVLSHLNKKRDKFVFSSLNSYINLIWSNSHGSILNSGWKMRTGWCRVTGTNDSPYQLLLREQVNKMRNIVTLKRLTMILLLGVCKQSRSGTACCLLL